MSISIKLKISLTNPTGNFWIDNGIVTLYELYGNSEHDLDNLLDLLVKRLVVETGNVSQYYDIESGQMKRYMKKNWQYPANIFIKSTPQTKKIEIRGKQFFTSPPKYGLRISFSKKKVSCDICGSEDYVTKAKMWMFPFAVEPGKFSNFYSGLKLGTNLCPRCAIAGLGGYLGWLWKTHGNDKLHIFIFHSDLDIIYSLRKNIFRPFEKSEETKGGNVPLAFYGDYIHETTLGLVLRLLRELVTPDVLSKEGEKLLEGIFGEMTTGKNLTLYGFSGEIGKAFNMDSIVEFSDFKTIYRLYLKWIRLFNKPEMNPVHIVENVFRQFQKKEGRSWNSIWRDSIAWAILELRDPTIFIESFLFEARVKSEAPRPLVFGTIEIFETYFKEVINMDEKLLNVLKGFGHSLGRVSNEKKEMGLLFALRNAKNPDDFFKVLNDIQFRLELTIPEDILQIAKGEQIKGSPWLRVKTILSIYAMNTYLIRQTKQNQED